jgi:YHS domain-containing protein
MRIYSLRLGIALAAPLIPHIAWAQHEAHQTTSPQVPSAELTQCLRVQPVIDNIITSAMDRAERARLSNSPSEMRAAVESLEAALRDIRAQSAPCSTAAALTPPHAGHTMATESPASAPPTQAPADAAHPHAGHLMPSAAPAKEAAPAEAKPGGSKAAIPHAGYSLEQSGEKEMDPVNGLMVDPAKAPKTTYHGRTYYFSSEQSRKEFLENPAKFAKKPKG